MNQFNCDEKFGHLNSWLKIQFQTLMKNIWREKNSHCIFHKFFNKNLSFLCTKKNKLIILMYHKKLIILIATKLIYQNIQ
jgi:hypothetical protein